MATKTSTPPTIAEARERLAETELRVGAGNATAADLAAAEAEVEAARLRAGHAGRVAAIDAAADNVTAAEAQIAWLEGDEITAVVDVVAARYAAAVDALVALDEAWAELRGNYDRRLRTLRRGRESWR